MRKSSEGNRVTPVLLVVLVLSGCKEKPLRVGIAPGYSGDATIGCRAQPDDPEVITVGSTGKIADVVCSRHRTALLLTRTSPVLREKDGTAVTHFFDQVVRVHEG